MVVDQGRMRRRAAHKRLRRKYGVGRRAEGPLHRRGTPGPAQLQPQLSHEKTWGHACRRPGLGGRIAGAAASKRTGGVKGLAVGRKQLSLQPLVALLEVSPAWLGAPAGCSRTSRAAPAWTCASLWQALAQARCLARPLCCARAAWLVHRLAAAPGIRPLQSPASCGQHGGDRLAYCRVAGAGWRSTHL